MITENNVKMPRRGTIHSAGYDFFAPKNIIVYPRIWTLVDTGVKFDGTEDCGIENWVFKVYPRSGLSSKYGLRIINTVPIIDQDYRDTIKVKLSSDDLFQIKEGERFMQGIFVQYGILKDEIEPTEERKGGYGSTGRF